MDASTAVHSNAFNFLAALQSGVDPRTGQYTVTIELPEIKTNYLSGPSIPLALGFNPLHRTDRGFGYGWRLQLTQFDEDTQIISLHTGETYKVESWDPDSARAIIPEQRLDTFHFYVESDNTYRVMHASGEMEILVSQGTVAVSTEYYSAHGQKNVLAYTNFNGYPLLNMITDADDLPVLLVTREPGSNFVYIDLYPYSAEGGEPIARFSMELSGDESWVTQVHLPSDEKAKWELTYKKVFECLCIESVSSPAGSKEEITYDTQGHAHPDPGSQPIPRVFKHVVFPLFDQPAIEHQYSYSTENFLGYGAGDFEWDDEGLDNLYKVIWDYTYSSTQTLIVDNSPVRTQERTFNRYHLLNLEVTTQNGHVHRAITQYAINQNQPFHQQVAYCQMPVKTIETWYLADDINQLRSVSTSTTYNNRGLVTSRTNEAGVVEQFTYYSPDGEDSEDYFCPPDAEGFVRCLRDKTVIPAAGMSGPTPPTLLTRFSYTSLGSLAYERMDSFTLNCEETLFEIIDNKPIELQKTLTAYIDDVSDSLLHGRFKNKTIIVDTTTVNTEFAYSVDDDPTLLEVIQTDTSDVKDQAPLSKRIISKLAIFDGQPRQIIDGSIVQNYRYDSLGRLIQETIAPGTEVEASKFYTYTLSVDGSPSKQVMTNVNKVETHTYFDGLNRIVSEYRLDPTHTVFAAEEIQTYSAHYDAWGNLVKESTYDWLDNEVCVFTRSLDYDNWGQQYAVTAPDGSRTVSINDPIGIDVGTPAVKHPTQTNYVQSAAEPTLINALTVTVLNTFEKPLRVERLTADRRLMALKNFSYDGFGRCVASSDESDRITHYSYDSRSRLLTTTLADLTRVTHTYAPHSTEALHASIRVKPNNHLACELLAGEQQFDGFARTISKAVGTLQEQYDYVEGQGQVSRLTKTSGKWIDYKYDLRLTAFPTSAQPKDEGLNTFEYNKLNATITEAINSEGSTHYEYDSRNQLIEETRTDSAGHELKTLYTYTANGLPLSKTDSTGMTKRYSYDPYSSRLASAQQYESDETKALSVTYTYNSLGQVSRTVTQDNVANTTLTVDIEYDDHGREILRTQTLNTDPPRILSQRWLPNDLLDMRELKVAGVSQLLERFEYDAKGRMRMHLSSGQALPKDRYGNEITRQVFRFDALDNIQRCLTEFSDGKKDLALFTYAKDDSCRLLSVSHDHPSYTPYQAFMYDADGNMLNDEQGQHLFYDTPGRLVRVEAAEGGQTVGRYRYDAHNQLIATQVAEQSETLRFYEGNQLSLAVHEGISTHLFTVNDQPIGQQQRGDESQTLVLLTDASHTVVGECLQNQLFTATYTAYGERSREQTLHSLLAFNGEVLDEASGWYLLGKGYRAYNPHLMRFHSPDSMSPFGQGGLNPYGYCLGNPTALKDPTGHAGTGRNKRIKRKEPRGAGVAPWLGIIIGVPILIASIVASIFAPPAAAMAAYAASFVAASITTVAAGIGFSGSALAVVGMTAYWATYGIAYGVVSMFTMPTFIDKAFFAADVALTGAEVVAVAAQHTQAVDIIGLVGWAPFGLGFVSGFLPTIGAKASKTLGAKASKTLGPEPIPNDPHVTAYDHFPRASNSLDNLELSMFYINTPAPSAKPAPAPTYKSGAEVLFEEVISTSSKTSRKKEFEPAPTTTNKAYPTVQTQTVYASTGLSVDHYLKTRQV